MLVKWKATISSRLCQETIILRILFREICFVTQFGGIGSPPLSLQKLRARVLSFGSSKLCHKTVPHSHTEALVCCQK